jgi:small GTP-binding protein
VIGSSGAGKTSIVRRLTDNKFVRNAQATVGIEYFVHVTSIDSQVVKMMIWDTAGQERFYTIAKAYFRNALGVILVFDITDRKSFESLPRWLRDARTEADPHCTIILVGNKSDLAASRVVFPEEAQEFARTQQLTYIETSAVDGSGIENAFHQAARDLLQKVAAGQVSTATAAPIGSVKINQPDTTEGKCSC